MKIKKGIDRYSTFGLREKWLRAFLDNSEHWLESNNQLGVKQIPAVINWLRDAELLKKKEKLPTELCSLIVNDKVDIDIVWEIILVNLSYNSTIFSWFFNAIKWGSRKDKKELLEILCGFYSQLSEGTLNNPLSALFNTIEQANAESLKNIVSVEKKGNKRFLHKKGSDNVNPISILYSLYKYAEKTGRYSFTISDLYSEDVIGGPYKIFGISKSMLEIKLIKLQSIQKKLKNVSIVFEFEFDTINLRDDITTLNALKLIITEA